MNHLVLCALRAALPLLALARLSGGSIVTKEIPYEQYGHLWNTHDGTATGNPVGMCAATAITNSFSMLQNRYPDIYGTNNSNTLVPLPPRATRDALNNGYGSIPPRPGINGCPMGDRGMWEVKNAWIQDFANGTTFSSAEIDPRQDTSQWAFRNGLHSGYPSFGFLLQEIMDGEDVEINIESTGANPFAHSLTLTRLSWDDANDNGRFDPGEMPRSIGYIDPNNPTRKIDKGITLDANGAWAFMWDNGDQQVDVFIRSAMSESPFVPAPASATAIGLAGLLLAARRRRA